MDEVERDFCISSLDLAEQVINSTLQEFDHANNDRKEELIELCEQLVQYVVLVEQLLPISMSSQAREFVEDLRDLISLMTNLREEQLVPLGKGRPRINIEKDKLEYLIDTGFMVKDIAMIFDCSTRTIERRAREYHLSPSAYTSINDAELDYLVNETTSVTPQSGEKTINGKLRSQGIHIQRWKLRNAIHRVDPMGVEARKRRALHRRVYSVESANSLWHLDGYHKLIRWKIVVHGGIDGYSRLVTYLQAATNNRASTVLSAFMLATEEYGLPSRIRTDKGGENVLVSQHLLEHPLRGTGRGTVITGRSVHNQRIERLWRDLYSGCISYFYNYFYSLEDIGLLDCSNNLDLYTLHITYLSLIQHQLDLFREGWANHSLRTEKNRSPKQLWILGMRNMTLQNPDHEVITGIQDWSSYGIDFDGPISSTQDDHTGVVVEDVPSVLSSEELQVLRGRFIQPDTLEEDSMIQNFIVAKSFVQDSYHHH